MLLSVLLLLCVLCTIILLWKILKKLEGLYPLITKLDKPTKEERISQFTVKEAQKEAIRSSIVIEQWAKVFSNILVNDLGKALSKK